MKPAEDNFPDHLREAIDDTGAALKKEVWARMKTRVFEDARSHLQDESVPWDDRLGYLVEKAIELRSLTEEGFSPRPLLVQLWKAAEGSVWFYPDEAEQFGHPMLGRTLDFYVLMLAVFAMDPDIWRPLIEEVRREKGDEEVRFLLELAGIQE